MDPVNLKLTKPYLVLLILFLLKIKSSTNGAKQFNSHNNISDLLDNLLRGYDNSVRPDFGGQATVIDVDLMIRSMGPVSEIDMTYSMDCYFRQSWVDKRLAFTTTAYDTLALSISMLARIWKPDTYFLNGKQSYLHTITTPNKFVRLHQDGRVLYSSRLTIKAGCPMNLEDFPMDVQRCPLKFGSFGYTSSDVIYKWNDARQAVAIAEDMKLSQFDLVDYPAGNITDTIVHNVLDQFGNKQDMYKSEYSMLLVSFHLQRHMGNFLIQVYGPCFLLVVLSWVSFWLNREATADRVSLGITTVLTMTFLGLEARTDLPKVPYPTALDFFVFLSFAFIFSTIIQFAFVHYFTKYGSGECYFNMEELDESSSEDSDEDEVTSSNTNPTYLEVIPLAVCSIPLTPLRESSKSGWQNIPLFKRKQTSANILTLNTIKIDDASPISEATPSSNGNGNARKRAHKRRSRTPRFNSVSKIDRFSRAFFPLSFLAINIFYWYLYLYNSARNSMPVRPDH